MSESWRERMDREKAEGRQSRVRRAAIAAITVVLLALAGWLGPKIGVSPDDAKALIGEVIAAVNSSAVTTQPPETP